MSSTVAFGGYLAADPERDLTPSGTPVAKFRVLVDRNRRTDSGEWVDHEPTPHDCRLYGQQAANLLDSAGRGDRLLVHGVLETDAWTDKQTNNKRTKTYVRVHEVGPSFKQAPAILDRRTPGSTVTPA